MKSVSWIFFVTLALHQFIFSRLSFSSISFLLALFTILFLSGLNGRFKIHPWLYATFLLVPAFLLTWSAQQLNLYLGLPGYLLSIAFQFFCVVSLRQIEKFPRILAVQILLSSWSFYLFAPFSYKPLGLIIALGMAGYLIVHFVKKASFTGKISANFFGLILGYFGIILGVDHSLWSPEPNALVYLCSLSVLLVLPVFQGLVFRSRKRNFILSEGTYAVLALIGTLGAILLRNAAVSTKVLAFLTWSWFALVFIVQFHVDTRTSNQD